MWKNQEKYWSQHCLYDTGYNKTKMIFDLISRNQLVSQNLYMPTLQIMPKINLSIY